jgi:hypothetical protein
MQKLDVMVLNSLADRVFTAARVRLMLESLARQAKDSGKQQQRQLETLNRELAAVQRGMERHYEGIEQGVLKLDDTLRHRTDKLQAQRQAILTDIEVRREYFGGQSIIITPDFIVLRHVLEHILAPWEFLATVNA